MPETPLASIVSPSFAAASAARSEPEPLSLALVTKIVVACVENAVVKSSAVAIVADLMAGVNLFFILSVFHFFWVVPLEVAGIGIQKRHLFCFSCAFLDRMAGGGFVWLFLRNPTLPRNSSPKFPYS